MTQNKECEDCAFFHNCGYHTYHCAYHEEPAQPHDDACNNFEE